ncbi:polyprenyl synthetase family protein [Pelagibacterium xiamenense]|uniref:polyprenyl synthetase family protein n=1 Tax=Pelagibacterium xiamenense TaxID=2901140 RepID=UPI001E5FC270|nr:farnesyl diphosphate synthase [Pelagibacterium xiamenense]MCD7061331.1 polyprenyl synthetase family protein [Pelagibacterium xiamenense]
MNLTDALAACAADTETFLAERLAIEGAPARLLDAMAHGALDGGKRLRPFLVRASAEVFGVAHVDSLAAGAALEMVHCYSLVHDDLPDMDNDEMRRGKPTVWKAFDPALAILAGDALLTEAFGVLADPVVHADPAVRAELIGVLAASAGALGMVGGQVADIEGETTPLDEAGIIAMQRRKTGALIRAGVEMGAILGRADAAQRGALVRYGEAAGLAFQLADDILDVTATSADLGKTAGKDVAQNKSTIVARRGVDGAREMLAVAVEDGIEALSSFRAEADMLRALIAHFAERKS